MYIHTHTHTHTHIHAPRGVLIHQQPPFIRKQLKKSRSAARSRQREGLYVWRHVAHCGQKAVIQALELLRSLCDESVVHYVEQVGVVACELRQILQYKQRVCLGCCDEYA